MHMNNRMILQNFTAPLESSGYEELKAQIQMPWIMLLQQNSHKTSNKMGRKKKSHEYRSDGEPWYRQS